MLGTLQAIRHRYRPRLWNHARYRDAVAFCGFPGFPTDYFVFSVERNPLEKVKSFYFHEKTRGFAGDFSDFCRPECLRRISDFDLYADADGALAARIYRYEQLDFALHDIAARLDLPPLEMAHAKTGMRTGAELTVGPKERDVIHAVFAREFEAFAYPRDLFGPQA